ncbi:hypothetical protein LJC13_01245, partial [Peptostreptococcaceae bacterium OttesenSCG-928-C18]|nr:hypothetical protein [Peptostreptococcaceae bacterium OttesenSCG-928-C18]
YTCFKKEVEDITGEEFDLTTRMGVLKVRVTRTFGKLVDEIFQDRYDSWGILDEYDGDQEQVTYSFYFREELFNLLMNNGLESRLYVP